MRHIDYVYVSSYSEFDQSLVVGLRDAFAKSGQSFVVVGYVSRYVEQLHAKAGVEFINLREPGPLMDADERALLEIERLIESPLSELLFPEGMGYRSARSKLYRRLVAIHEGYKRLFAAYRIGCMIHKLGAELVRRLALEHARAATTVSVFLGNFPAHYPSRVYLHGKLWSERDSAAAPVPNRREEGFAEFVALLERIRDRREVIRYPAPGNRSWSEAGRILASMMKAREFEFLDDIIRRRLVIAQQFYRQLFSTVLADDQIPASRFYYFPLHVYDDSQITLRNPQFCDQLWILEYISRSLPADVKLVVKFHPGLDGSMALSFVRALRRLANVVVLKGSVNSHKVVERCAGVIVINSTVAYEALLHEKPVLVLGRWSFGRLGLTMHVDDLAQLPKALYDLQHFRVSRRELQRKLYDLYGEMYDCSFNREPLDYVKLATALQSYVNQQRTAARAGTG